MKLSRRNFLKLSACTIGYGAIGLLGFDTAPAMAQISELKISQARIVKSICPYCSVSCGVLVYMLADETPGVRGTAMHIEGNPDDPVNRGALCPKGAALKDFLNAPSRLTKPLYRSPGMAEWKEVSWDWAIDKMAVLIKDTRESAFIDKDNKNRTVNRCENIAAVFGSTLGNEEGYLGVKIARALGLVALETQARI